MYYISATMEATMKLETYTVKETATKEAFVVGPT
jgi:hypothetical protein